MRDIFVVARNYREFDALMAHIALAPAFAFEVKNKLVRYVQDVRDLSGVHGARIIVCGQYFKRRDWPLIEPMIEPMGNIRMVIR